MSQPSHNGPNGHVRVMAIDGSALHRRALVNGLEQHDSIDLIGTAINSDTALAKMASYAPHVVAIDTATEELGGVDIARKIREGSSEIGLLLMAADDTSAAALAAIPELSGCATIVRPAEAFASSSDLADFAAAIMQARPRPGDAPRQQPTPAQSATAAPAAPAGRPGNPPEDARPAPKNPAPRATVADPPTPRASRRGSRPEIVIIGCSTGGPNALSKMLPELPSDFPLPVLVVQHMPNGFTKSLAESLNHACKLPVSEATDGKILRSGEIVIAQGGKHLGVVSDGDTIALSLSTDPAEHSCRPAVDYSMRSVAKTFGKNAIGVIMTGMGEDGWAGCRELHTKGAQIIAQDEASCTVFGMPRGPVEQGLATIVAPLDQIASSIINNVRTTA